MKLKRYKKLENRVAADWPKGYVTDGSGSVHGEADVRSKSFGPAGDFIIECKFRDKPNFILTKKVFDKLEIQCLPRGKKPVWAFENSDGEIVAIIRWDDLVSLINMLEKNDE